MSMNTKLKILVIVDGFWPDHTGGISKSLLNEVRSLSKRGHEIVVITRRLHKNTARFEREPDYTLYRYPAPPKGSALYRLYPWFTFRALKSIDHLIENIDQYDIAYIHNPIQALAFLEGRTRIPMVYCFHAPHSKEIQIDAQGGKYGLLGRAISGAAKIWFKKLEVEAVSGARSVIVRSEYMRDQLLELAGSEKGTVLEKTQVIPLGVDLNQFVYVANPRPIREKLGLPVDRTIILTVRRLVKRMGLETLINAMKLVVRSKPDVLLLIAGKGYLEQTLQDQVRRNVLQDNVRFLGFVAEEDLRQYYQAADLFVMPTEQLEGFGLATIEAMSCGTPVVATPVGANQEVVGGLSKKLLAKDATADSIAEVIVNFLLAHQQKISRLKVGEYCERHYSITEVVKSLEGLFRNVIGSSV